MTSDPNPDWDVTTEPPLTCRESQIIIRNGRPILQATGEEVDDEVSEDEISYRSWLSTQIKAKREAK